MIGITNPHSHEIPTYLQYDIQRLKGNFRVMEIVLNRNGQSNGLCPLYFDGAINNFRELPLPTDVLGMEKVYAHLETLRKKSPTFFINEIKKELQRIEKNNIFAKLFNKIKTKINGITS